ncbi:MAG TPA: response regulator transcription factor [Verrucomicrobiae bacterium]|nr:response regulator transcription factor [Verrucomicrobiae bacterium]
MLLEAEGDIEVVGEAQTGRQAVQLAKALRPAVIVMDIAMPLLNGFEATRQILKSMPAARIIILSAYSDEEYVKRVLLLGASGYIIKQTSYEVLSKAIREVQKGNRFFSPSIAKRLPELYQKLRRREALPRGKKISLSSREVEVLQLIAEGNANKQIAAELDISIKTVEKHRQHLMEKLNIHDTAGLTRYAIAAGIIESSIHKTPE